MSSDIHIPLPGPLNKQTVTIFAAGLLAGLSTLYLPSLLSPSTKALRSLLLVLYPLTTHTLALLLWYTTRHQPSLSPLSSLHPSSPLRYTYLLLIATLLTSQLLLAHHIPRHIGAATLVYIASLLAYFPHIVHTTLTISHALHIPTRHSYPFYLLLLLVLLLCVGCGFPYVGSEYALSRRDAGLAWYVLRIVVEVCYTLMMTSRIVDDGQQQPAVVVGIGGEKRGSALSNSHVLGGFMSSSGMWMIAHVVRIGLWALLAYVCRLYENGQTKLF